ncbi:MAG: acetyltransferase [Thermoanaerobaculia bacterium]
MPSPERLLIFGASGHGRVVAEAAAAAGLAPAGWADDDPDRRGSRVDGLEVLACGTAEAAEIALEAGWSVVVAVGDNRARRRVMLELAALGAQLATVVHPRATISPTARLGEGSVALAGVVINAGAQVGSNVILNTSCSVDHDCRIGDHAHLSPGVHLGGAVEVGEGTHLGVGVSVRNQIKIGAWSLVGAGAAVVSDIDPGVVAWGVPAKPQRRLGS